MKNTEPTKKGKLAGLIEKIRSGIKSFQEYRRREAQNYARLRRKYKRSLEPYVEGFLSYFSLPRSDQKSRGTLPYLNPPDLNLSPSEIGLDLLGGFDINLGGRPRKRRRRRRR